MKVIRYSIHFPALIVAGFVFWLARDLDLPASINNFRVVHYGLMGLLHALAIVVSLRDRKAIRPLKAFGFIALAALWSAFTPIAGLWGSIVWLPITAFLPPSLHNLIIFFITGSAIGSSGYWLLVRWFWMKSLRRVDLLRTVMLCVAATSLVGIAGEMAPDSATLNRPELWSDTYELLLTVGWWFAFSISLYWSEMRKYASKPTEVIA